MRTLKKILNLVPLMLLWLMLSAFVWSWIFTFLTDAPREEKIVLFVECPVSQETLLAVQMEKHASPSIRMAQVKPFSYSMMSSEAIMASDLYIVSESGLTEYLEWFLPLPENALSIGETCDVNGVPYGIRVYDSQTGDGILKTYIAYPEQGEKAEDHFLVFGKQSCHIIGNENAVDDEAVLCAQRLFEIE